MPDGTRTADIVVIGGGIAGCALAYFLSQGGRASVALLERDVLGGGSTAHSMGGVRQQFSTPMEVELSKRALRFWRTAEDRFASPCPFHQDGYLFVTQRPALLERLAGAAAVQRATAAGPVEIIGPEAIAELAPWLVTDGLVGGSWSPEDGRVNPTDGLHALAAAARRSGVAVHEGFAVRSLRRRTTGWEVAGPTRWHAAAVVVACGVWTPPLVADLGHDVRIDPLPLRYAVTDVALANQPVPFTIDLDSGLAVEREGAGLCLSLLLEAPPPDYSATDMLADLGTELGVRAPQLRDVGIRATGVGPMEMSPDGHPYAGRLEEGLWVLAGFGGHGTMHAPVLSEQLAAAVTGAQPELDLSPLDPHRRLGDAQEWMVATRKT